MFQKLTKKKKKTIGPDQSELLSSLVRLEKSGLIFLHLPKMACPG